MHGKGVLYYKSGKKAYEGYFNFDQFDNYGKYYNEQPVNGHVDLNDMSHIGDFWTSYEGDF